MPEALIPSTRRVGWFELFFDLVFVVAIERLTGRLELVPSGANIGIVAVLLAFLWSSWLNVTLLTNITGEFEARFRPFILASMAGIALMAVAITDVERDWRLAILGYAIARIAVWPVWIGERRMLEGSWVQSTLYGPGAGSIAIASIWVPWPCRAVIWGGLLGYEVVGYVVRLPALDSDTGHMIERVGLFTMIVMGESVARLILSIRVDQSAEAWLVAASSFALVCVLWWIYFDLDARHSSAIREDASGTVFRDVLVLIHYLLILALIVLAAGLGIAITKANAAVLPLGASVCIFAGSAGFYTAQLLIVLRYHFPRGRAIAWAVPGIAASLAFIWVAAYLTPPTVVIAALAIAVVHLLVGNRISRSAWVSDVTARGAT